MTVGVVPINALYGAAAARESILEMGEVGEMDAR